MENTIRPWCSFVNPKVKQDDMSTGRFAKLDVEENTLQWVAILDAWAVVCGAT